MSAARLVKAHPAGTDAGSGRKAAPPVERWLGLAAAPTFATMALWSAFLCAPSDMMCGAMRGSSAVSGMTLMYLLMSLFHSLPWLTLIANRQHGAPRHSGPCSGI